MAADQASVLLVDDEEMNRDMLQRRLSRQGYDVTAAAGGREALAHLDKGDFDLVLLDIMMPDIDGMETLARIRATYTATQLPVIMVTAKDASEDIVAALEAGANDFVTKPLDMAVALARMATHISLKRSIEDVERMNKSLKEDLAAAAELQHTLLPAMLPEFGSLQFAWAFEPCTELGGDILNVFRLSDQHIGFYLLDVSGHGVKAALMSVTLSRMLMPVPDETSLIRKPDRQAMAWSSTQPHDQPTPYVITPPVELANRLNNRFQMDNHTPVFFTFFYGMMDLNELTLRYVCAGHPGPVCFRQGSDEPLILGRPGSPVGVVEEPEYEEFEFQFQPGDQFYLWSDGLIEARNRDNKSLGGQRLLDYLLAVRGRPIDQRLHAVVDRVREWSEGDLADDVSMLSMDVAGEGG